MPLSFGAARGLLLSKGQESSSMILEIDTSLSTGLTYNVFAQAPYNLNIDWGDGTSTNHSSGGTFNDVSLNKTYSTAGIYEIKITGSATGLGLSSTSTNNNLRKLRKVLSWGNIANLTRLSIGNQSSLTEVPNNLPPTVTNLTNLFYECQTFNQDISGWNTANVVNMFGMFSGARAFNNGGSPNINNWNTSNVQSMQRMFYTALAFNQPIGSWDTSKVGNMIYMLGADIGGMTFNQNIGAWNLSACTDFSQMFHFNSAFNNGGSPDINNWALYTGGATINMFRMFRGCASFNQPIGNWNMSRVRGTNSMFESAGSFNQNIGAWNLSACIDCGGMFGGAAAFNNGGSADIGNWNVSNVTSFASTFINCVVFNQNIGAWDVSKATSLASMFQNAAAFNQNIGSWNVSKVTNFAAMFLGATAFNNGGSPDINNWTLNTTLGANMSFASMFQNATSFNQPIGNWDTSSVYVYNQMFNGASAFNQNIGSWKIGTNVATSGERTGQVTMPGFLRNVGMNSENYSRTLIGWANYIHNLNDDFTGKGPLSAGDNKQVNSVEYGGTPFSNGVAARAFLLSKHSTLYQQWYGAALSNDGTKMFAAGGGSSFIFKSDDTGNTWKTRITDIPRDWRSVTCTPDGTKVAAVAFGGNIWTSADGGETWTERTGSGARNWTHIACSSDGTKLIASVSSGFLYTSSDSGVTWTARMSDTNRSWQGVASSSDGVKLIATAGGGQIYTSTDSGVTWTARESVRNWSKCCSSADGNILAAVVTGRGDGNPPGGYIYVSTDSGVTWNIRATDQQRAWQGISCSSDGSILAAASPVSHPGTGGYIHTSSDGGTTWTLRTQSNPSGVRTWGGAVAVSGNGATMLAGSYSTSGEIALAAARLHRSTNTGATWTRLALPNSKSAAWSHPDAGNSDNMVMYVDVGNNTSYTTINPNTLFDLTLAGTNATLINSPSYDASAGGCLSFNGSNQYAISAGNLGISGNANFTLGGWFYLNSIPTDYVGLINLDTPLSTLNCLCITIKDGQPAVDFCNTRFRATSALSTGAWHHIVVTKSAGAVSTTSKIYVNGVEVAGALEGSDGTPNIVAGKWILGRLNDASGRYFNGKIATAIAHAKVLTAQEIANLYNAQKSRYESAIVTNNLVLNLDAGNVNSYNGFQNSINTWNDLSGLGHNATLNNGAYFDTAGGGSIKFDGGNDNATLVTTSALKPTTAVTVETWVYPDALPNGIAMVLECPTASTHSNPYIEYGLLLMQANRTIHTRIDGVGAGESSANAYTVGAWNHLAMTWTNGVVKYYSNGVLIGTTNPGVTTITYENPSVNVRLGSNPSGGELLNGKIAQARVYSSALSDAQILQNFNATKGRYGL